MFGKEKEYDDIIITHVNVCFAIAQAIVCLAILLTVSVTGASATEERSNDTMIEIGTTTMSGIECTVQCLQEEELVQESEGEQATMEAYHKVTYSKDWDSEDGYLLAKIAMAEAEGCSTETKALIIYTVLNRVWSDDFPDTIQEVIFQERNGIYQFSPIGNGRWDSVEPNEDCWKALDIVAKAEYDYSGGALYFESCSNANNWHSRNLEYLYESSGLRFYK